MNSGIIIILGGAGFCPPTVCMYSKNIHTPLRPGKDREMARATPISLGENHGPLLFATIWELPPSTFNCGVNL